ncbi:MAG TPA: endoglucanase A, partial [Polyangiaceae bacterium]|nr:endoglucanase A [Polyangiaceae bacterium]
KSDSPLDATIDITHTSSYTAADVYRITSASAVPQVVADLTAASANELVYRMPAYSVSVIVPRT